MALPGTRNGLPLAVKMIHSPIWFQNMLYKRVVCLCSVSRLHKSEEGGKKTRVKNGGKCVLFVTTGAGHLLPLVAGVATIDNKRVNGEQ